MRACDAVQFRMKGHGSSKEKDAISTQGFIVASMKYTTGADECSSCTLEGRHRTPAHTAPQRISLLAH